MANRFQVGQVVEVDIRHWINPRVDPLWERTEILHAFTNGTYNTPLGVFIEEAVRETEVASGTGNSKTKR